MKRLLISSLLIFFLLPGCASLQTKREVVDNTLYSSSNPKIQVKVSPEFEYLGEMKDTSERQAVDSTTMLINRADWYVFVDSDGHKATRAVSIRIERTQTQYISDLFGRRKHFYEKGTCKLGGRNFQYFSHLIYPNMRHLVTRFVAEKGYVLPRCVIAKEFAQVYGAKGNILVDITYLEDPSNLYHCKFWSPDNPLSEDQRAYLEQFNERCESSFAVLKYDAGKAVYSTAENYRGDVNIKTPEPYGHINKKYINIQSRQPIN
jgi:hypothetical protein